MPKKAKKRGRPRRKGAVSRLNLIIATPAKRRASKIAFAGNKSVSRFIEDLVMNAPEAQLKK